VSLFRQNIEHLGQPLSSTITYGAFHLVRRCDGDRQQALALAYESRELLALAVSVARQSRGVPIDVTIDARTQPFLDAGRATFHRWQGQLNLSCAQCHDDNWGRSLEWQSLGSLQLRFRNCLVGIRAEPWDWGAPELVDLELYLMWRARGMPIESPAVRP
jgi:sulfur-oxidizing protein SoxA